MTLGTLAVALKRQWVVILAATLIGLMTGAMVFTVRPAEFTAKLTMYVSAQGADSTSAAYQGAQLSQDRVTSYTQLVTSTRVSQDVIAQLGLPYTPESLSKKVTASNALDSVLIDVAVSDQSPTEAARIANAVGQNFTKLVAELERPVQPGVEPAVTVRPVQQAMVPDAPSSMGLRTSLALGLLVGIAVGIACAVMRNANDTSIKSPEQLTAIVNAPSVGIIAYDPDVEKRPLTVHENPQSPRSEAFRQLRTNLQFIRVDSPPKVIVFTSAMPAEGKTTTLANLAIAIASTGSRVLVIEADLRRPKMADLLGLDRTVGLTSVLSGRVRAKQATQVWGEGAFDLLASGPLPPNPSELLASQSMTSLLNTLRNEYDIVLLDSPPLLPVTDAAALAPLTDGAIFVCKASQTNQRQVDLAVRMLEAVSSSVLGTILTMVPRSAAGIYTNYNSYYGNETAKATPPVPSSNFQRPSPRRRASNSGGTPGSFPPQGTNTRS